MKNRFKKLTYLRLVLEYYFDEFNFSALKAEGKIKYKNYYRTLDSFLYSKKTSITC